MTTKNLLPQLTLSEISPSFIQNVATKYGLNWGLLNSTYQRVVDFKNPHKEVGLNNPDRKWEIVSSMQKAVRRGDELHAIRAASAILNHGDIENIRYMWRRLCTTVAEDIGLAEPVLMAVALLCAETYTPTKYAEVQKDVVYGLLHLMCAAKKDRTLCDMSIMEGHFIKIGSPEYLRSYMTPDEMALIDNVSMYSTSPLTGPFPSKLFNFLIGSKWRTEGMGSFVGLALNHMGFNPMIAGLSVVETAPELVSPTAVIKGLPSYAYDMHTQIGKRALRSLASYQPIKQFFEQNPVKDIYKSLGWAAFYCEGGTLDKPIVYDDRNFIEKTAQMLAFRTQGFESRNQVEDLLALVKPLIPQLDVIRNTILSKTY